MYFSSNFIFAILYYFWTAVVVVATSTPACLISAIGVQPNPSDVKGLCTLYQHHVISNMTDKCIGVDENPAKSAYAATCSSEASIHIVFSNSTSKPPQSTGTASIIASLPSHTISSATKPTSAPSSPAPTSPSTNSAAASSSVAINSIMFIGAIFVSQFLL